MAELIPAPFEAHVHRIFTEHAEHGAIYDLPVRKFWLPNPRFDARVRFHGAVAGSPVGPAAGPHTQLAQNLVLSWLAGARILELKTVQLNDTLTIPRPCIDAATIGFNVEWSQELRLAASRAEYVRGWTLIHALAASGLAGVPTDRDVLFDLSVGYDLAGVQSPAVSAFIEGLRDARSEIDALRRHLPARVRDCEIPGHISDCATISTFHGCPPEQIAAIAEHLMDAHGLHVVVKLNPTLLGRAALTGLLHDQLGYTDLRVPDSAFEADLQFPDAIDMIRRLRAFADARGLTFGVKLTNTLVVENHKGFFSEPTMYMSGQPLHVIALALLGRLRTTLAADLPDLPFSFSAGIDKDNFADAVALGLVPVTVCTDLLRTGGYGRLSAYLRALDARMHAVGATDVDSFILKARAQGKRAVDRTSAFTDPWRAPLLEALATPGSDLRGTALAHGLDDAGFERIVRMAAVLNTPPIVEGVRADPRYQAAQNARPPRKLGRVLALFDCTNCDKCVPVCPNDANFTYTLAPGDYAAYVVSSDASGVTAVTPAPAVHISEAHQLANFADFCNECGNCDVFCPEDGGPYVLKPRYFGSEAEMDRHPTHDGIVVSGAREAVARFRGVRYRLAGDVFSDGATTVRLSADGGPPTVLERRPDAPALSTGPGIVMGLLTAACLDRAGMNPIRAEIEARAASMV
jgi:putative selenate reductase